MCFSRAVSANEVSRLLLENLRLDPKSERDLIRAYRLFKQADDNGDGRIQKGEFAKAFKLDRDVFFDRLFELIDTDDSGYIDFREFVIVLAAFQLSNSTGRVRFAFRLLDLDNSGAISKEEFKACIQASVGMFRNRTKEGRKRANPNDWRDKAPKDIYAAYKDLFAKLDRMPGNALGYNDFADICVKYPKIFTPVNYIWNVMRRYSVPAAELCKVIARSGHRQFFYNSMLEEGWPGVKFSAPPLALADRNVYMRSLSNVFRQRGSAFDDEDARMSPERDGRRTNGARKRNGVRPQTSRSRSGELKSFSTSSLQSPTTRRREEREFERVGDRRYDTVQDLRRPNASDRIVRPPNDGYDDFRHSDYDYRDGGRNGGEARQHRASHHKPLRQFAWGDDDPESDMGKRELQASSSMERAYREEYPIEEEPESWLDDDMRSPSSAKLSDRTFEKQDSIEEIWNALRACPSARATRHYAPNDYVDAAYYKKLDDGAYYKKNFSASIASGNTPPTYQHER